MSAADSHFGPVRKWGKAPQHKCYLSTSDTERLDLTAWDLEVERAMAIVRPPEAQAIPDKQRDASDVVWILTVLIAAFLTVNAGLLAAWLVLDWWICGVIFGAWWVGIVAVGVWLWRAK